MGALKLDGVFVESGARGGERRIGAVALRGRPSNGAEGAAVRRRTG
jgi:hypothetical protein